MLNGYFTGIRSAQREDEYDALIGWHGACTTRQMTPDEARRYGMSNQIEPSGGVTPSSQEEAVPAPREKRKYTRRSSGTPGGATDMNSTTAQEEAAPTTAEQPLFRAKNLTKDPAVDGKKDADKFLKDVTALQRMSRDDAMNRIIRMLDEIEAAEAERYHTEAEQFKLSLYRHDGYTTCLRDLRAMLGTGHRMHEEAPDGRCVDGSAKG